MAIQTLLLSPGGRHPPEETGHVVPLDPVLVLVVEYGQAGLVKELLQALDRQPAVVLHVFQFAGLETGLEKTRIFFKPSPVGFLFFCIFAQKREFLGFFQFQEYF